MSTAARVDISVDQGADFALEIYWTDYNTSPYQVIAPIRMHVRDSTGNLILEFLPNTESAELDDIGISYNSERGLLVLSKTAEQMEGVSVGSFLYDLYVTYEDRSYNQSTRETVVTPRVAKLLYGTFTINGRVTTSL